MKLQSFDQFLKENKEFFYEIHLFYQREDQPNDLYLIPEKDLYVISSVIDIVEAQEDGMTSIDKKDLLKLLPKIEKYWYGRYIKGNPPSVSDDEQIEIVVEVNDDNWEEDYYVKNEVLLSIAKNKLSTPSKSYEVYRYENPDTYIGAYRDQSWKELEDEIEKNTRPGMKDDYYWADDPTGQQWLEALSKIYLSGCESIEQLQEWFSVYKRILKDNFIIAKYTVSSVVKSKSNTQVAFCTDDVLSREIVR
jgi:hypothetical protein